MRRVLHVISGLGTGGAETMLVQLACALRTHGFNQRVVSVSDRSAHADKLEACAVPVVALEVASIAGAPFAVLHLAGLVNRFRPDIIQGWMYHGDLFAALAHRLVPGRRRLFWNIRASNTDEGGYGGLVRCNARLSRWPDLIIANSQAGLDFHLAWGYRPRQAEIIPNGIDTETFRPDPDARAALRSELGLSDDVLVVIHVARVNPMKDHATFLTAMASLPRIQGLLVGAGTDTLSLPANVRALGLRQDVERLYSCADIVVSTSAFAEGFSNVIAEGMSAGLVPVATDVGDARQLVGDAGYIIPPRDPEILAKTLAIEAAMPDRPARGTRARARIVNHFTLGQAVERYARLYAQH